MEVQSFANLPEAFTPTQRRNLQRLYLSGLFIGYIVTLIFKAIVYGAQKAGGALKTLYHLLQTIELHFH